jgi:hypothetical protein
MLRDPGKAAIRELTRNYANEIINTEQIKKSKGDPGDGVALFIPWRKTATKGPGN